MGIFFFIRLYLCVIRYLIYFYLFLTFAFVGSVRQGLFPSNYTEPYVQQQPTSIRARPTPPTSRQPSFSSSDRPSFANGPHALTRSGSNFSVASHHSAYSNSSVSDLSHVVSAAPTMKAVQGGVSYLGNGGISSSVSMNSIHSLASVASSENASQLASVAASVVGPCSICGCLDFSQNVFKKGNCNNCFHKH